MVVCHAVYGVVDAEVKVELAFRCGLLFVPRTDIAVSVAIVYSW